MSTSTLRLIILFILPLLALGCAPRSTQTWENVKTAGRYMQRGVDALFGKEYESRMLSRQEEFLGPGEGEFIPMNASDLKSLGANSDQPLPQPKTAPGEFGAPSFERFYEAPHLYGLQRVHFDTDQHVLKEGSELQALEQVAAFLKKTPAAYLLIEGHTDERASASYNLALGMRRANYIRGLLVKRGVNLNRIYTVSKGKEEPLALGHHPGDWSQNRRAEFKIFEPGSSHVQIR